MSWAVVIAALARRPFLPRAAGRGARAAAAARAALFAVVTAGTFSDPLRRAKARRRYVSSVVGETPLNVPILGAEQSPTPRFTTRTFQHGRADINSSRNIFALETPQFTGGSHAEFMSKLGPPDHRTTARRQST